MKRSAAETLDALNHLGACAFMSEGQVKVHPPGALTDDLRQEIEEHGEDFRALLPLDWRERPAEVAQMTAEIYRRIDAIRPGLLGSASARRLAEEVPDLVSTLRERETEVDEWARRYFVGQATREDVMSSLLRMEATYLEALGVLLGVRPS